MNLRPPHIASIAILHQCLLQIATMMPSVVTSQSILSTARHGRNWPITPKNCLLGCRQLFTFKGCDPISTRRQSHAVARSDHSTMNAFVFLPTSSNYKGRESMPSLTKQITPPYYHCQQRYFTQQILPHNIHTRNYNANRYERFRQCLMSVSRDKFDSPSPTLNNDARYCDDSHGLSFNDTTHLIEVGKSAMEVLSSNRRSFNRTWKRMKPLMELIILACEEKDDDIISCIGKTNDSAVEKSLLQSKRISSVADIGCDHGILSVCLASMAWVVSSQQQQCNIGNKENNQREGYYENTKFFSRVVGADMSSQALENGGFVSLKKMGDVMMRMKYDGDGGDDHDDDVASRYTSETHPLPIEFRLGCGLEPLQTGEADAVILAGMGVHTMLDILFGKEELSGSAHHVAPVDVVQTNYIFLQPTNSRPQHMMILYDRLQKSGDWVLRDENITFLGGRWYINTVFERCSEGDEKHSFHFPGHCLVNDSDYHAYDAYVKHHLQWLKEVYERSKGVLEKEDGRWLEYILSAEENDRWKSLASWFIK